MSLDLLLIKIKVLFKIKRGSEISIRIFLEIYDLNLSKLNGDL